MRRPHRTFVGATHAALALLALSGGQVQAQNASSCSPDTPSTSRTLSGLSALSPVEQAEYQAAMRNTRTIDERARVKAIVNWEVQARARKECLKAQITPNF
jgi:hypothetical protein